MALFLSFTHSLLSPSPRPARPLPFLIPKPLLFSFSTNKPHHFSLRAIDPNNLIPDEWGEKVEPEPEAPAEPDPPRDTAIDDEWGEEGGPELEPPAEPGPPQVAAVDDEWGEKGEPEPEPPEDPVPRRDYDALDDEWGPEGYLSGNGGVGRVEEADAVGDLKRCLVDSFYGVELGLKASPEVRAEISEIVGQLEALNPNPRPNDSPALLDGTWILLYTAFSELLPLIALSEVPFLRVKEISQVIDTNSSTIVNATTISSPFASVSFSATASFEVRSPSRIQVRFKEGTFEAPVLTSKVDLPENIDAFGQKIDLLPVQRALNPIQEAAANITRALSGQPPLKVPIPGEKTASWLLTTYLDKDLRISRGDAGLFVLARKGSPLLDQLT